MRLIRLNYVYPEYWHSFYARHPYLAEKTYKEQLDALFYDAFYQTDSFSHYLNKLGYDTKEILTNPLPLQKQWAKENGFPWQPQDFERRHALEMVKRFRPEIVYLNYYSIFNAEWVRQMRDSCPWVRLVLSWCAVPVASPEVLSGYDVVLTSSIALLEEFRRAGHRTELLRHAFDPRVLERIDQSRPKQHSLSFIGSLVRAPGMHNERAELVERMVKETEMAVFCNQLKYGSGETFVRRILFDTVHVLRSCGVSNEVLKKIPLLRKAAFWSFRPRYVWQDPIDRVNRGVLFGLEMFQALADSRSTLNMHIGGAGEYSGNIRMFEATGTGTCLLTDWKKDLGELFEIDREVVAYRSAEECVEKSRWLMEHPKECEEIGRAGQQRTLRDHSYANRVEELDALIRHVLN
jgi:spore maturation protein CgeB